MRVCKRSMNLRQTLGKELRFFSSLRAWRAEVLRHCPKAKIKEKNDVHRVFVRGLKLAVFGSFPGHGWLMGRHMAEIIFSRQKCHNKADAYRGVSALRGIFVSGSGYD